MLTLGELRRFSKARQVYDAYQSRKHAEDWVKWAQSHPDENELLNALMIEVANDK